MPRTAIGLLGVAICRAFRNWPRRYSKRDTDLPVICSANL